MDLLKIIPNRIKDKISECAIEKEVIGNKLLVNFKFKSGRKSSVIIRRFVNEKTFFFGLGLFGGEGSRRRRLEKRPPDLELTNSDPILIQCFMQFLINLGFDRKRFKTRIQISCKKDEMKEMIERSTRFWQRITKVPIQNFGKPNVRIRDNPKQKSENGSVNIKSFSQPLWRLLMFWLKNSKSLLSGSKEN